MKRIYLILAATLFAGFFTSCGDETAVEQSSGTPAQLEIALLGSTSKSGVSAIAARSHGVLPSGTGDISDVSEGNINRVTVGVFKASTGALDVIKEATTLATGNTLSVTATVGDREIFVVANAPAGHFDGVSTKDEFIAKTVSLDVTKDATTGQLATNLPMSGQAVNASAATTITLNNATATAVTVELKRLVSRVSIAKVVNAFDATGLYAGATFTPTDIFLYQAKTSSNWAVNAIEPTTTDFGQGESGVSTDYLSYLGEAVTDYVMGTGIFTDPYYFYTFANNSTTAPTKLVIKGTYTIGGVSSTRYYPITINKAQIGTVLYKDGTDVSTAYTTYTGFIERNKRYALTATIKGPGSTDPDIDVTAANVSLTVSVAAWDMTITQDVTFE
jgi:hypothetical protein